MTTIARRRPRSDSSGHRPVPAPQRQLRLPGVALRTRSRVQGRDQPARRHRRRSPPSPWQRCRPSRWICPTPCGDEGVGERTPARRTSAARSGKLHIALSSHVARRCGDDDRGALRRHAATRPIPLGRRRFRGADQRRAGRGSAQRRGVVVSVRRPSQRKASYRIQISTENPYRALANGELMSRRTRAAMTTWTYEQAEPTSTYLVTLQIGVVRAATDWPRRRCRCTPRLPHRLRAQLRPRLRPAAADDEAVRQAVRARIRCRPATRSWSPTTTWRYRLRRKVFRSSAPTIATAAASSERLIAHELAHQWFGNSVTARRWRDIWLHEGFACYAEWLWSEDSGGQTADEWARHYHQRLADSPQDLLLSDPGPRDMFDDRVYKRGALTLHALRDGHRRRQFLCAAAGLDDAVPPRHRGHRRLHRAGRQLRRRVAAAAVGCVAVLHGRARPVTDRRDRRDPDAARSPAAASPGSARRRCVTALCGYAVLYLAARDLEPAGFSVFGVFWGAFGLVTGAANGLLQEATREVRRRPATSRSLYRPAHTADAGGGDGRRGGGGGDRCEFAAVVGPRVRRVAVAQRRAAERRDSPGSACTPRCWACWRAWTGGRSTGR